MRKFILATAIIMCSVQVFAETNSISSTVKWNVSAKKDTQNTALMVTPLKALTFKYREGNNSFNSDTAAFDISTVNADKPTDVKIVTKVLKSKLLHASDDSTLAVGIALKSGEKLSENKAIVFLDEVKDSTRPSSQGNFVFTIDSAATAGVEKIAFKDLTDGKWCGEVSVQFTAYWTEQ